MTNAFLCTPHEILSKNAIMNINVKDAHLLMQRHKEASIQVQCPDRDICLRLGEAGMVGDHGGPVSFMSEFHPGVEKWEKEVAISNEHLLEIEDPITNQKVDIGITTYVDGIQAKHVINTTKQRKHELTQKLQKANELLDQS